MITSLDFATDINSLFTAIPLEETIKICAHALFDIKAPNWADKENFIKLLRLVEFSPNDQMYKQLDEVASGFTLRTYTSKYICGVQRSVVTEKDE